MQDPAQFRWRTLGIADATTLAIDIVPARPKNFAVVEPDRLYRSGQIQDELVHDVLAKHQINTPVAARSASAMTACFGV